VSLTHLVREVNVQPMHLGPFSRGQGFSFLLFEKLKVEEAFRTAFLKKNYSIKTIFSNICILF
jgi:hypothetical protein